MKEYDPLTPEGRAEIKEVIEILENALMKVNRLGVSLSDDGLGWMPVMWRYAMSPQFKRELLTQIQSTKSLIQENFKTEIERLKQLTTE